MLPLSFLAAMLEHGDLANYYLAHSARADMYRGLGRTAEARSACEKALALDPTGTRAAIPAGGDSGVEEENG
jgi:predicted RNA polymerase sigma factor